MSTSKDIFLKKIELKKELDDSRLVPPLLIQVIVPIQLFSIGLNDFFIPMK